MSLITSKLHKDERSAVLSIAENRASKVAKIRADCSPEQALRFSESLCRDVREHIETHKLDDYLIERLSIVALNA